MRIILDKETTKKILNTGEKFGISEINTNVIISKLCDEIIEYKEQNSNLLKDFNGMMEKFYVILQKRFPEKEYIELNALKEIHDIYREVINNEKS